MSDNKNLIQLWGNHTKRQEFLENYKAWDLWFNVPETEWTLYRYTIPGGATIVALEYRREPSNYSKEKTGVLYYTQREGSFINPDFPSSIWNVADLLKNAKIKIQQENKKGGADQEDK